MSNKEQVLSWLDDEESLVTSQRIQQHCRNSNEDGADANDDGHALSRRAASDLLQEVFLLGASSCGQQDKYVATLCTADTFIGNDDNSGSDDGYKTTGTYV